MTIETADYNISSSNNGVEMAFLCSISTKCSNVAKAAAQHENCDPRSIVLRFEGEEPVDETLGDLGVEDGDAFEVCSSSAATESAFSVATSPGLLSIRCLRPDTDKGFDSTVLPPSFVLSCMSFPITHRSSIREVIRKSSNESWRA